MQGDTCEECGAARQPRRGGRGLCHACYQRLWRRGECPAASALTVEQRIDLRTDIADDGCWLWTGGTNGDGYGTLTVDGRTLYVHRLQYERYVGPIPRGLQVDHLCGVTLCVRPTHLEAVTQQENLARRGRTAVAS